MDGTAALIEKHKARLNPENDFRKIFRTLQKLNEIAMTIELLQATGIGKAVNSLRKTKGLGDFAKEIVNKWKKLVIAGPTMEKSRSPKKGSTPRVKSEQVEYDPAQNWEMTKQSPYKPSVKQEELEDTEYDPTKNWQLEISNSSDALQYQSTTSPVKIKKEKSSPTRRKKKKPDDGRTVSPKGVDPDANREAELLARLQRTQEELKRIKKQKKRSDPEVKVERVSPERETTFEPSSQNIKEEVEEYDPRNNFELSSSPSTYDPGSQGEDAEYDPGPVGVSMSYQPSITFDPMSPRVGEQQDDDNDSEASYEKDEPGAYLLHPRRASSDSNRPRSSENSADAENLPDSFVLSTTLYERNNSVDSEDGTWGSKGNGIKVEKKDAPIAFNGTLSKPSKSSSNSKNTLKHKSKAETKVELPSVKKQKTGEKLLRIKQEKQSDSGKTTKKDINHKKASLEKRKNNDETSSATLTKRAKTSSDFKAEKSEVREAGFLFQDIPEVVNLKKKKKKSKIARDDSNIHPIASTSKEKPKLNLHLPQIQAMYRPLPQPSDDASEKRKPSEMTLTDIQAAELHSTRQTTRMQVYSGGSGGFIPKMMSLFDQCMTILMNNIDAIDVFGGIPFEIVQPILKKCTPEQLYRLEDSNPYLLDDTDELWKQHAIPEFRGKKPHEMESWREMFLRLSDEREAKLQNLAQKIQAREANKKPFEKKVMLAYVGANAKPPRSVRRAQEKYGTGVKSRHSSRPAASRSIASAVRREIVDSRMSIPEGTITAASIERENKLRGMKEVRKPRVAPMMAKTLRSIGKLRFKR